MKKIRSIKSIYMIFMIFLVMILLSFGILFQYSSVSLRESLMRTARIQMDYSETQLDQKVREFAIEADGILNSDSLKNLQLVLHASYDAYDYVTAAQDIKSFLQGRQRSNVGMAEFILYWPEKERIISSSVISSVNKEMLALVEDNEWLILDREVYYARKYRTDWDSTDDEPFVIIQMERDYLYGIKNMALEMGTGGTMLTYGEGSSLFPTTPLEQDLLSAIAASKEQETTGTHVLQIGHQEYQVVEAKTASGGMKLLSYYPIQEMLRPVRMITLLTGIVLAVVLVVGLLFLFLYYKHILLQMKLITEKLRQVENGDITVQIHEPSDNEFSYVYEQFNRMVTRIRILLDTSIKEQQLRNQAELRQLQLQINPHFLYNSLSYIVTVAEYPQAVTRMAVHLAKYYRYCTRKKSVTTVGEEIEFAGSYLTIMAMRKNIEYSIQVPEEYHSQQIIPLILQPIIENAIEHGIEERENAKHIYIKAVQPIAGVLQFEISDDGDGMTEEEIAALKERLGKKQREEQESVGLWNVNQRLINYYDASAALEFGKSIWGGLMVSFRITVNGLDSNSFTV